MSHPSSTPSQHAPSKIAVVGLGYVGMSMAVLLARQNQVTAVDVMPARVEMVNNRVSPIEDADITRCLQTEKLDLRATTNAAEAYAEAEYVVIATPTDYDADTNRFNTRSVEAVIQDVLAKSRAVQVAKNALGRIVRAAELTLLMQVDKAAQVRKLVAGLATDMALHIGIDHAGGQRANGQLGIFQLQGLRIEIQRCFAAAIHGPARNGLAASTGGYIEHLALGILGGALQKGGGQADGVQIYIGGDSQPKVSTRA